MAGSARKPRSWVGLILKVLLPLLLLALVWHWLLRHADFTALLAQARLLPLWAWAAAGLALLGGHGLRALRLQQQWRHLRPLGLAHCLRLVLTHNAAVIVMPLRSGEAGYLWLVYRHWGVGWREAGASLLRWRLQDATVLLVLALLLLLPWSPVGRLLLALCLVAIGLCLRRPVLRWTGQRWPGLLGPQVAAPHWLRRAWLASTGNWTLKVLALGGLLAALSGIDLQAALRGALGGELAGVQPLQGPAGLGTYQAGVWLAVGPPQQATVVAAALAVQAFALAVALGAAALAQLIPAPPLNDATNHAANDATNHAANDATITSHE